MHIAMMIDNDRLVHEHLMLKRLSIGLIDQGVRLTRIVPDDIEAEPVLASERGLALASRVRYPLKVLPWRRAARTELLVAALERSLPDVIYAVGRDTWPIAIDLADAIDRPMALEICSAELVEQAPRKRAARSIGGYVVPTAPLATMLRHRVDPDLVSLVPMGVAIPTRRLTDHRSDSPVRTVAIIGSGRDLRRIGGYSMRWRASVAICRNFRSCLNCAARMNMTSGVTWTDVACTRWFRRSAMRRFIARS